MKSFYDAWWELCEHPYFEDKFYKSFMKDSSFFVTMFPKSLDINVQKVNPISRLVEDDERENTKIEVWLECGHHYYNSVTGGWEISHDCELDCGGDTFEEAIINLAELVEKKYPKDTFVRSFK